jgi:hypothetical protein
LNTINSSDVSDGFFLWNVLVCDNQTPANCSFAPTNFSLNIDTTPPSIALVSPDDGNETNSSTIAFLFGVVDASLTTSCVLYLNSTVYALNASVNNDTLTVFNPSGIANGNYSWNISCVDLTGNAGWSATRSILVAASVMIISGGDGAPNQYVNPVVAVPTSSTTPPQNQDWLWAIATTAMLSLVGVLVRKATE